MSIYWWGGHEGGVKNWGDRLNGYLMMQMGVNPRWASPADADMVMVGSVLHHLPHHWTGTVLGAGLLQEDKRVDLSHATVLALRGKLTDRRVKRKPGKVVYGDPGLLVSRFVPQPVVEYDLGIVPHWTDTELAKRYPQGHLIDPSDHPEKVIAQIARCKRIISSSLHGLIVADSYGIPRQAERFNQIGRPYEGGDFKYEDYASIYGTHPHFGQMWRAPHRVVSRVQDELWALMVAHFGLESPPVPDPEPIIRTRRCPQISLLVPFRDDGEHRSQVWHWLKRYWYYHLESVEIIQGHDTGYPFSKAQAVNDAASRAKGRVFVILDADAYMDPGVIQRCADNIDRAQRHHQRLWYMPYCADIETEILTRSGWKNYDEVNVGDTVLTLNHDTGLSEWQPVTAMNVFDVVDEPMLRMESQTHSSLTTMNHRWAIVRPDRQPRTTGRGRPGRTFTTSGDLTSWDQIPVAAYCSDTPTEAKYQDPLVELVGWFWTEGRCVPGGDNVVITQSHKVNGEHCDRIRAALTSLFGPARVSLRPGHNQYAGNGIPAWREWIDGDSVRFYLNNAAGSLLKAVAPDRVPANDFLLSLTQAQLELFVRVSLWADGHESGGGSRRLTQKDPRRAQAFALACILAGESVSVSTDAHVTRGRNGSSYHMTSVSVRRPKTMQPRRCIRSTVPYTGKVWCPTTENGTWFARRNGKSYFTGNSNLYRIDEDATKYFLLQNPWVGVPMPSPPPQDWLEPGRGHHYGHQYGAMVQIMPREAFYTVRGEDGRFRGWGCTDEKTEILTRDGWKKYNQVKIAEEVLTLNHTTGLSEWNPVQKMNIYPGTHEMLSIESKTHSSLTTLNHRWPVIRKWSVKQVGKKHFQRQRRDWATSETFQAQDYVPIAAECADLPIEPKYTDALVQVVGWFWTEGHIDRLRDGRLARTASISQSAVVNPDKCDLISGALTQLFGPASAFPRRGRSVIEDVPRWNTYLDRERNMVFNLNAEAGALVQSLAPGRVPSHQFLLSLTKSQLLLFIETSMLADGHSRARSYERVLNQKDPAAIDAFQFALILAGHSTSNSSYKIDPKYGYDMSTVSIRQQRRFKLAKGRHERVTHEGVVWCPTTENGTWLARRNGKVYFTGNSEDASMMRALDTLWTPHEVTDNDLWHFWHAKTGHDWRTRRWIGQNHGLTNSRLAQRYAYATGEPELMQALVDEHESPRQRRSLCRFLHRLFPCRC